MKMKDIDKDTIVTGIYCKKCKKSFSVRAFDHLGMNEEKVAYGCPTCQDDIRPHKSWHKEHFCSNCNTYYRTI